MDHTIEFREFKEYRKEQSLGFNRDIYSLEDEKINHKKIPAQLL